MPQGFRRKWRLQSAQECVLYLQTFAIEYEDSDQGCEGLLVSKYWVLYCIVLAVLADYIDFMDFMDGTLKRGLSMHWASKSRMD